ncbi:MAG: AAA family ATPase [Jatrophihabitans sp.]
MNRSAPGTKRSGDRPVAVFIGGPPASGKTTLATALAPALGAALLDLDVATGPLTNVILELIGACDLSEPRAAQLTREPRYETLFGLAEDTARAGTSAVLVGPFGAECDASRWAGIATRLSRFAEAHLVWLTLPPAELVRRLAARGAARDAVKLQDPAGYGADLDSHRPTAPHLPLDATRPVQDLLRDVLEHLEH